jgi:hypothetical protein
MYRDMTEAAKPKLKIYLAAPRGFCAGVVRAIEIVERALAQYGAPVYVRHEIVHNRYVVDDLKAKGAIFVDELSEIPDDGQPVIFSAHGVAKSVPEEARARKLFHLDATCPLVTKVHMEAERHHADGLELILIGHHGHPEVIGTTGQLPDGAPEPPSAGLAGGCADRLGCWQGGEEGCDADGLWGLLPRPLMQDTAGGGVGGCRAACDGAQWTAAGGLEAEAEWALL